MYYSGGFIITLLCIPVVGIASLYKYGQTRVNPGDMLFLMRNLATNCGGLHRIAARTGFQKVDT